LGSDRNGNPSPLLPVQPLVGVVAEIDDAATDQIGAAAVFMDARANIEGTLAGQRRWGEIRPATVGSKTNNNGPPAFLRPGLDPVELRAVEQELTQTDGGSDDQVGRDRRRPRAIRRRSTIGHACLCAAYGI